MSFTAVTISGQFNNPDGTPASGTFCATPSAMLSNTGVEQADSPICGVLSDTGALVAQSGAAFIIKSTEDSGTLPVGEYYTFTLSIDGQSIIEFNAPLPVTTPITFAALRALAL